MTELRSSAFRSPHPPKPITDIVVTPVARLFTEKSPWGWDERHCLVGQNVQDRRSRLARSFLGRHGLADRRPRMGRPHVGSRGSDTRSIAQQLDST